MDAPASQSSTVHGTDDTPSKGKQTSSSVDFIAGGLVSAISKIIVYPMETKVLLLALGQSVATDPVRLWHGVSVKATENFVYNGLVWFFKDRIRPPPPDPAQPDKRPPASFLAAWILSCVSNLLVHPLTNTVAGMQASLRNASESPASASKVATAILHQHGFSGFFKGWELSVAFRIGSAMTLVVYDWVRVKMPGFLGPDVANFVAASLGRLTEVWLCHPIKTLRARKQQGQVLLSSFSLPAILGLWNGVGTMALADAVKIGIRFGLIERVRILLQWLLIRARRAQAKKHVDEKEGACEQPVMGG